MKKVWAAGTVESNAGSRLQDRRGVYRLDSFIIKEAVCHQRVSNAAGSSAPLTFLMARASKRRRWWRRRRRRRSSSAAYASGNRAAYTASWSSHPDAFPPSDAAASAASAASLELKSSLKAGAGE